MILVPAISSNLASENRNLTASDVYVLIEPSIFLLELARGIIEGSYETFDDAVQRSILFDIERTSTQARQTFEIPR